MSVLLGIFDRLLPGTSLYLVFAQSFFFLSLYLIVSTASCIRWWALPVIIIVAFSPLVTVYQGIVWKDVLFANISCFAFVLVLIGQRQLGASRILLNGVALSLGVIAGMVRQNGLIVPVVLGALIVLIEAKSEKSTRAASVRLAIGGIAGAVTFFVIAFGVNALIHASAVKPPQSSLSLGSAALMRYDIIGIVARSPEPLLKPLVDKGLDAKGLREDAARYYSADRMDWLGQSEVIGRELNKLDMNGLTNVWFQLIISDPRSYLSHRLAVFRWLISPPDIRKCLPLHVGVSGPIDVITNLGLVEGVRPSDQALYSWSSRVFQTPLFNHAFYLVLGIALMFVLVRGSFAEARSVAGLLIAAGLFTGSWFILSIACDFRYNYFLPLAVSTAAVALATLPSKD
jgi:hypothetical protein